MIIVDVFKTCENLRIHSKKFINPEFEEKAVECWEKSLQLSVRGKLKYQPNVLCIETNIGFDSKSEKRKEKCVKILNSILTEANPFQSILNFKENVDISNLAEREFSTNEFEIEGFDSILSSLSNKDKWNGFLKDKTCYPYLKLIDDCIDIRQFFVDLDLLKDDEDFQIEKFYEYCRNNGLSSGEEETRTDFLIPLNLFYSFLVKVRYEFQNSVPRNSLLLCPYFRSLNYATKMKINELSERFEFGRN